MREWFNKEFFYGYANLYKMTLNLFKLKIVCIFLKKNRVPPSIRGQFVNFLYEWNPLNYSKLFCVSFWVLFIKQNKISSNIDFFVYPLGTFVLLPSSCVIVCLQNNTILIPRKNHVATSCPKTKTKKKKTFVPKKTPAPKNFKWMT